MRVFHQDKGVHKIEGVLNKKFSTLCTWFVDYKLSVQPGKITQNIVSFLKLNVGQRFHISYGGHDIKQYHTVEYSGCHLNSNLKGKSTAIIFFL